MHILILGGVPYWIVLAEMSIVSWVELFDTFKNFAGPPLPYICIECFQEVLQELWGNLQEMKFTWQYVRLSLLDPVFRFNNFSFCLVGLPYWLRFTWCTAKTISSKLKNILQQIHPTTLPMHPNGHKPSMLQIRFQGQVQMVSDTFKGATE